MNLVVKDLSMGRVISIILLLFYVNVNAQTENIGSFSRERLEDLSGSLNYDKMKRSIVPRFESEEEEELKEVEKQKQRSFDIPGSLFAYIIGGLLLIIILYNLTKVVSKNIYRNEIEEPIDIDEIQDIDKEDLDILLQSALENRDFRSAFRIQFLKLLQVLSTKEMISWEPIKTNGTYVRELKVPEIKPQFRSISRAFDHIWYGNSDVKETDYLQLRIYVSRLIETIDAKDE